MSTLTPTINVATATKPLLAFHGSQAIKEKYLARVREHRAADEIVQKFGYWKKDERGDLKGCGVGCTLHSDRHSDYEKELGIPVELAHLEDGIFENLPNKESKDWPVEFLEVIPVGADLTGVWKEFIAWLLVDEKYGVVTLSKQPDVCAAVKAVADCYLREIAGETVPQADWDAAGRDAWVAWVAWDARDAWVARVAWVAWVAWDAWDARDAWDAWVARVARVAWDAWDARDAWDAWDEYVCASAKKLLALLAGAKTANSPSLSRSAPSRQAPVHRLRAGK